MDAPATGTRILVLSNMYPPHAYGGYEMMCADVVERFRRKGHRVEVLTTTMRLAGVDDMAGERATGVRRDLAFYWDDHVLLRPPVHRSLGIERANQRALAAALDEFEPEVVSVWNMGAMSLGLLTTIARRGIPMVFNVCDDWLYYGPHVDSWSRLFLGRVGRVVAPLVRLLAGVPTGLPDLDRAGAFCFTSHHTRDFARTRTRWEFPRSAVMYSGIDPADFPLQARSGDDGFGWRLLYAGRIDPRKGIDTLLRALDSLPDHATASILGTGDAEELSRLRALCVELGVADRVSFGAVPRSQLRAAYEAADAVVFPSTWAEPFGLVPVEAMAIGALVLGTGRGGSDEFLIDGFNCLRFPPGDHEALAAGLRRLAGDPALRRQLREGGFATAAELTVDRTAAVLEEWHVAAARRFAGGEPPHRPLEFTRLARG
jgi:glycosyltransferase involved in cell wall biosynthesis